MTKVTLGSGVEVAGGVTMESLGCLGTNIGCTYCVEVYREYIESSMYVYFSFPSLNSLCRDGIRKRPSALPVDGLVTKEKVYPLTCPLAGLYPLQYYTITSWVSIGTFAVRSYS